MKKVLYFVSALLLITSCYEPFERDYDGGAGLYVAYQYDLRTFVIGENESVDFTVALGGVVNNEKDRKVDVKIDNTLLTKDLSSLVPDKEYASFTAIDAFKGSAQFGNISQSYVSTEVINSKINSLAALPDSYYEVSGLDNMYVNAGRHTAVATIKATKQMMEDPKSFAPYFAIGFQIVSGDCNEIVPEYSFEIMAVKCEHFLYGNWSHGGVTTAYDSNGKVVDEQTYELANDDLHICKLTTSNSNSVVADKIGNKSGKLLITVAGDNSVTVTSADGSLDIQPVAGKPSTFNGEQLIQNRKLELNYQYTQAGVKYVVSDQLVFRNRIRDGVNEYQDERTQLY